ncbi:hypothetical protein, partial [Cellulomonas sp. IC4_254]|uniref:hypothetical protein n=1 Tax=Cellulomonas sp. IC4_254 TaxID=2714040 RepID=UPI00141FC2D8
MGFLDRLLGREPRQQQPYGQPAYGQQPYGQRPGYGQQPSDPDQAAIERYRYLLRTAPPDAIEQAHAEAFAQLTPEQRRQVLDGLAAEVPPAERATDDDPRSLARMATRAELRQPGTLERSFGRAGGVGGGFGGGVGMGGMIAGSLLASVAGAFVGTAIADSLFDLSDSGDAAADGDAGSDADAGADGYADGGDV